MVGEKREKCEKCELRFGALPNWRTVPRYSLRHYIGAGDTRSAISTLQYLRSNSLRRSVSKWVNCKNLNIFWIGDAQRRVICCAISGSNISNFFAITRVFFHKFIQVRWALLSSLLACCAEVPFDKVIYCTVSSLQSLLLLFKMFIKLLQYYLMTQSQWVH